MAWYEILITVVCSVMASSGFWALLQKKSEKKDLKTQILIGLGHDRIMALGMMYLERGDYITVGEYENLMKYLYEPYMKMGGNGSAEKVVQEIKTKLRIVEHHQSDYSDKAMDQYEKAKKAH